MLIKLLFELRRTQSICNNCAGFILVNGNNNIIVTSLWKEKIRNSRIQNSIRVKGLVNLIRNRCKKNYLVEDIADTRLVIVFTILDGLATGLAVLGDCANKPKLRSN